MKYNYTIKSLLLIFAMIMSVCGAWADTMTEGFEHATSSTNYTGSPSYSESESDCGVGWQFFYGCVSTSAKITDTKSAALRLYTSDNYGYMQTTTAIDGLSAVSFQAKAATTNSAKILMDVYSSSDGATWNPLATAVAVGTTASTFSYEVAKGEQFIKIAISSSSTKPTKTNAQFTVDDVKFTYASTKTLSSIAVSGTPNKTTYDQGDLFEVAGLVVTGTYSDDTTDDLTSKATWTVTPSTGLSAGTTSVSVTATVDEITSASYTVNGLTVNKYPYIKDKLTQTVTGVSETTYGNFSGKSVVSDAVYAGNCAGGSGSVQLRSTNNSGVISTTSGGYIRKVSVEWNSSTAAGRVLDVYGSNTAYTSAADLYDTKKCGTKLGSITYGSSTSLTITGDYAYVGVRSASGAMYLTSVTFEWSPVSPVTFRQAGKGYSTLYTSETALSIPEGVEAYYCTLKENGNMEPHALTSVIPASTPVVLHYTGELTADKTINFAHSIEEGEDASANVLRGTDEALNITSMTDNDFYVLSIVDGQVGFYKFGGDELAAGKAYYMTDKTPAGGEEYEVTFEEESVTITANDPEKRFIATAFTEYEYEQMSAEYSTKDEFVKEFWNDPSFDLACGSVTRSYLYDLCWQVDDEFTLYIWEYNIETSEFVGTPTIKHFRLDAYGKYVAGSAYTRGFILDFGFDGTTTGVSNVQTIAPAAKASFDLQGRRVMGATKGLVIKNGRVMLNR